MNAAPHGPWRAARLLATFATLVASRQRSPVVGPADSAHPDPVSRSRPGWSPSWSSSWSPRRSRSLRRSSATTRAGAHRSWGRDADAVVVLDPVASETRRHRPLGGIAGPHPAFAGRTVGQVTVAPGPLTVLGVSATVGLSRVGRSPSSVAPSATSESSTHAAHRRLAPRPDPRRTPGNRHRVHRRRPRGCVRPVHRRRPGAPPRHGARRTRGPGPRRGPR